MDELHLTMKEALEEIDDLEEGEIPLVEWLVYSIGSDLACGGEHSGVLNYVYIDGEPFWEIVSRVEKERCLDLETIARREWCT